MAKKSNKQAKPPAINIARLEELVKAQDKFPNNTVWLDPADAEGLEAAGFAECNPDKSVKNEFGQRETVATQAGIDYITEINGGASAPPSALEPIKGNIVTTNQFEIVDVSAFQVTPKKRPGGKRQSQYPFEQLEVGKGGIFIPVTADKLDPVKSLASLVANASKKYAEKVGEKERKTKDGVKMVAKLEYSRKFEINEATDPRTGLKGALITRVK